MSEELIFVTDDYLRELMLDYRFPDAVVFELLKKMIEIKRNVIINSI